MQKNKAFSFVRLLWQQTLSLPRPSSLIPSLIRSPPTPFSLGASGGHTSGSCWYENSPGEAGQRRHSARGSWKRFEYVVKRPPQCIYFNIQIFGKPAQSSVNVDGNSGHRFRVLGFYDFWPHRSLNIWCRCSPRSIRIDIFPAGRRSLSRARTFIHMLQSAARGR